MGEEEKHDVTVPKEHPHHYHMHYRHPPPIPPGPFIEFKGVPLKGLLHMAILNIVRSKPAHGSEIQQTLKDKFNIDVPKPLVYGLLRIMEHQGLLTSTWEIKESGPAKRVYTITEEGLDYLTMTLDRLKKAKEIIERIIADLPQ
ncbi:MAG: PadR family transcriptional regulator [Candidatus Bathyarchaeia archaeon]